MRSVFIFVSALVFCACTTLAQDNTTGKKTIEIIPQNSILPVIVSQPECPLQIEKVLLVKHPEMNNYVEMLYQVRNNGEKGIADYTVVKWFSDNTGVVSSGELPFRSAELRPGKIAGPLIGMNLTSSEFGIRTMEKSQATGKMARLAFIGIMEITFTDGSKYEAKELFDALEEHLRLFELPYEKYDESLRKARISR